MNKKLIRKMQTASGGPIDYKKWDNRKITSYTIPYIKEKVIKLTNAGKATGAKLSTNLLDSIADNAYRAKLPIRKALGIAFKESTFGNPTDDKSAWNLSSKIRKLFNDEYPGTYLHINNGHTVLGQHLINYHKGDVNHEVFYEGNPDSHKSIILEAFEFYKQHPDKYNPGLKNYQLLIDKLGDEAMQSPEVLKWYEEWEKSKVQVFRPEPYKINTNIQNTAQEFVPHNKQGGKMNVLEFLKNGGQIRKMLTAAGGPINWLRKRIYNNIEPFGYNDIGSRLINAAVFNKNEHDNFKGNYLDPERAPALYLTIDNIWGEYLHIPEKERRYSNGKYKIKNNGNRTFSLPFESMEDIIQTVNSNNPLLWGLRGKAGNSVVGEYDVYRDYDKNGDYLKYTDHWRINPYDVKENKEYGLDNNSLLKWYFKGKDDASFGLGTPVEIQGKYYLDDIYNVKGKDRGGHYLPEVVVTGNRKKQGGKMNAIEQFKEGHKIHIKKKNRGKFTAYCGGNVTSACIARAKASGNPTLIKRATFAANARKWKHLEGGQIRKMQTAAGGPITRYETLPNIEVVGYRPIELRTYKPLHKDYPFTGHSSLDIPIDEDSAYTQGWYSPYVISVDKTSLSKDYNLVTNNCADATLGALNYIFGTNEKPFLFTTPGDVRDYAINKLHGKVTRDKDGIDTILIPRNKNNAKRISKRALEWRKNKDDDTIYEFEYKKGGKAFIKGVNVLDSNPKMSKAASRRVKKADDGTKLNAFLKVGNFLNSDTGKAIGSTLMNGLSAGFQAKQMNDAINEYELASKAKLKKIMNGISTKDYYDQVLLQMNPNENLSLVVLNTRAYALALQDALKKVNEAKDESALQLNKIKQLASEQNLDNLFGGIALLGSLLNNKPASKVDNGTPSNSYFDNYTNNYFKNFTIKDGYKPNHQQLFNYEVPKLNAPNLKLLFS